MATEKNKNSIGQRQAQVIQNRIQEEELEQQPAAQPTIEAPVRNTWIVEGCGGIYRKAAETWRMGRTLVGCKNESIMVAAFDEVALPEDRMIIRDFRLIQEFGLTIIDEVYICETLVFLPGKLKGVTTHPYLLDICGSYDAVTHISVGDEVMTAKAGDVGVLTTLSALQQEEANQAEVVKRFVEKFWVVK